MLYNQINFSLNYFNFSSSLCMLCRIYYSMYVPYFDYQYVSLFSVRHRISTLIFVYISPTLRRSVKSATTEWVSMERRFEDSIMYSCSSSLMNVVFSLYPDKLYKILFPINDELKKGQTFKCIFYMIVTTYVYNQSNFCVNEFNFATSLHVLCKIYCNIYAPYFLLSASLSSIPLEYIYDNASLY